MKWWHYLLIFIGFFIFIVFLYWIREIRNSTCKYCKKRNTTSIDIKNAGTENCEETYKCNLCEKTYTVKYDDSPHNPSDWM